MKGRHRNHSSRRLYQKFAMILCCAIAAVEGTALYLSCTLPDRYYVAQGESLYLGHPLPITAQEKTRPGQRAIPAGTCYDTRLKVFGAVEVKPVQVQVVERRLVIPSGAPFGIKMFTEGVMVVGMSAVETETGRVNPAREAGIRAGDILLTLDGRKMAINEDVEEAVERSRGRPIRVVLRRDEEQRTVQLVPVPDEEGRYRAGIWVRDSSAGIGTMTYLDPKTNTFAGLGHAVCDVDTGEVLPLGKGEIVSVKISGVNRGASGEPGELRGTFDNGRPLGSLSANSEAGVFGQLWKPVREGYPIPMALRQEVRTGPAQIWSTLSGEEPRQYDIFIEKVEHGGHSPTKNMVIHVTDPDLLEKSGGIVQGMSGSPILQNGKLVGAVTHVLVNDPTRGYGIFIENMLEAAN